MLTYDFTNVDVPIYEYLYRCIKNDILAGNLKPGDKLPSKRSFAHNHGISTITIQNAYDQLISEGYVNTLPRKGYYVAELEAHTVYVLFKASLLNKPRQSILLKIGYGTCLKGHRLIKPGGQMNRKNHIADTYRRT